MIFQTVMRFILIISQTVILQETKTDFLSHDTMNQAFSRVRHFYHSVFDFSQVNCLCINELVIPSKSLNFFQRTGGGIIISNYKKGTSSTDSKVITNITGFYHDQSIFDKKKGGGGLFK